MKVLRDFRRAADALERLASTQAQAIRAQPAETRLADLEQLVASLELERARWEAEVEAMLMKAEGKLKAAANSEARERTMRKSYEKHLDPFDPDGEEEVRPVGEVLPDRDVWLGEPEGVSAVRVGVESDYKQAALRHKFM